MLPVRAEVSTESRHTTLQTWDNGSPDFAKEKDTRSVPEDTAVDTAVGDPFEAIEPDQEDVLTYSLGCVMDGAICAVATARDIDFFSIDNLDANGDIAGPGQIRVKRGLDFESRLPDGEYVVRVIATDPSNESDSITVTITATDVDEDPKVLGRAELVVLEGTHTEINFGGDIEYFPLAGSGDMVDPANNNEYTVIEPDRRDSISSWDLEGRTLRYLTLTDRPVSSLGGSSSSWVSSPTSRTLATRIPINVYELTIVAADTAGNEGSVDVAVVVRNRPETGWLVFTEGDTSFYDEPLMAQVYDPDDHGGDLGEPYQEVNIVTWRWFTADDKGGNPETACPADLLPILNATTNSLHARTRQTQVSFLCARAVYIDPFSDENTPPNPATDPDEVDERVADTSVMTVELTTGYAVRRAPGRGSIPTFEDSSGQPQSTIRITGPENTAEVTNIAPGGTVGDPLEAQIEESDVTLDYELSGAHASSFEINPVDDGQAATAPTVAQITTVVPDEDTPKFDFDDPNEPTRTGSR